MTDINFDAKWSAWNPEVVYSLVSAAGMAAAEHIVHEAQRNLAAGGHNDTGELSRSFDIRPSRFGGLGAEFEVVNTAGHAAFVDQGVEGWIYPLTASVLKFKPGKKGGYLGKRGVYNSRPTGRFSSDFLYRPRVRGQAATHFFTDAVNSLTLYDFL